MLPRGLILVLLGAASICSGSLPLQAGEADDLIRLLQERRCPGCRLSDVDLVHADLRDARLQGAELQRANLGQARLDGANLSGADLSFTSLRGASLRGADLRGSRLYGTDLRDADLSGARLNPQALEEAHWRGAKGISIDIQSHASLHNAGVEAAQAGQWPRAERLFSRAIIRKPDAAVSWVARGISRTEQTKDDLAVADFSYAASLYISQGNTAFAEQLNQAAVTVQKRRTVQTETKGGNGWGGRVLSGLSSAAQALAPLAIKVFSPISGLGF